MSSNKAKEGTKRRKVKRIFCPISDRVLIYGCSGLSEPLYVFYHKKRICNLCIQKVFEINVWLKKEYNFLALNYCIFFFTNDKKKIHQSRAL